MTGVSHDDCHAVLGQLYEFHDAAISEVEATRIRDHLLACEPCLDRYDLEEALRLLIRRCCATQAPEELRVRIRSLSVTVWTEPG